MEPIDFHGSDRVVGRAVVPSSEDTIALPPTQGPYRSMRREGKRRNSGQSYTWQDRSASQQDRSSCFRGGLRGAVGL